MFNIFSVLPSILHYVQYLNGKLDLKAVSSDNRITTKLALRMLRERSRTICMQVEEVAWRLCRDPLVD